MNSNTEAVLRCGGKKTVVHGLRGLDEEGEEGEVGDRGGSKVKGSRHGLKTLKTRVTRRAFFICGICVNLWIENEVWD